MYNPEVDPVIIQCRFEIGVIERLRESITNRVIYGYKELGSDQLEYLRNKVYEFDHLLDEKKQTIIDREVELWHEYLAANSI